MNSRKVRRWLEKRRKSRAEFVKRGEFPPGEFEGAMENIRRATHRGTTFANYKPDKD